MSYNYRLYTKDVAQGLTDFNDLTYHVLVSQEVPYCGTIALVFHEPTDQFIFVTGLTYEQHQSIQWAYGKYFENVLSATRYYEQQTTLLGSVIHNPDLTKDAEKSILQQLLSAREEGNIPDGYSLWEALDLTLMFMRENPEILEEDLVEELDLLDPYKEV